MSASSLETIIVLGTLILASSVPTRGQEAIETIALDPDLTEPSRIVAIAARVEPQPGSPSGLFVADAGGNIYIHSSTAPNREVVTIDRLKKEYRYFEPRGMAYVHPDLIVWEGKTRRIWAVDTTDAGNSRVISTRFEQPSHLAVSPHGLVAVIDGKQLVFLQENLDSVLYERSTFPEPAGLVFSSWDTVHVLDRVRRSLITITFNRLKNGEIQFLSETESLTYPIGDMEWEALEVYNGILYLANEKKVFAYLESDQILIPVLPTRGEFKKISQLAVSHDGMYLLDGGHLKWIPRSQPVDLALEGQAAASQSALIAFYSYLLSLDMLPTRQVRARKSYPLLEEFLLQEGVLIAPTRDVSEPKVRLYPDKQKTSYQVMVSSVREMIKSFTGPKNLANVICSLNPGFCTGSTLPGLEQDQELTVPDLRIDHRLGRERVLLEGQSLEWYIDQLVFSEELRRRINPAFLIRLNPDLEKVGADKVLAVTRGLVVVPIERWSVTAAVPSIDYEDRDSGLWALEIYEDVSVNSRSGFVEQSTKSMLPQPLMVNPPSVPCEALQIERDRWLEKIKYPGPVISADILQKGVRLGVLEHATTVLKTHQIFSLNRERPAWHSFDILSELVAEPKSESFVVGDQVVLDNVTFSPEAHHGTHVAALIGGRDGHCWSGLLPSAKLVLVDLTDTSKVQRTVSKAIDANVRVFNVSQTFEGPQPSLRDMIRDGRALWVVAAGNSGLDLNGMDEALVPAMGRWGLLPNIVTVAASDWDGRILQVANIGKGYVDLVAPGQEVLSASEQKKYGRATGTSQAAPQVAAAAALLVDRLGVRLTPGDAKARLIATADWDSSYKGNVWGGMLNFSDAVMFPNRNLLRTTTGAQLGHLHSMVAEDDPNIVIANVPRYYEREGSEGATAPEKIRFSQILSLKRQDDDKLYRVVFRERRSDQLKILLSAKLEDDSPRILGIPGTGTTKKIKCSNFEIFSEEEGEFKPDRGCENGLSITQIKEYIQGGDYQIRWGAQP